jgi:hypothetical protein
MILGGISQFFPASLSSVIVGAYVIIFGLGKFEGDLIRSPEESMWLLT